MRPSLVPGIALSCLVAGLAYLVEFGERHFLGNAWLDGVVFAIILGTLIRTVFGVGATFTPGIQFSAKTVLEVAIVLLGASISFATISASGGFLVAAVAGVVMASLVISYSIGRMLGLSDKLATLIACGNSICGNSAIVAAAPVIKADSEDVAASIAFTAALGVLVVLLLPVLPGLLGLSERQYGVVAGLTVYAVPQVLAATFPVGPLSVQVGALVKLMRVLMLGPTVLFLGLRSGCCGKSRPSLAQLVPWFIVGFVAMMTARSFEVVPEAMLPIIKQTTVALTIVSMAALGLSVNIRTVLNSGGRVLAAGALSIAALAAISVALIAIIPLG
ncbi:YeiH family protein [Ensifer adhaerens]|uniref:Sulfate exporter family transporter n=1 Tax=Ensifer adhaerens TaxID=106592 RepID=A0A9Q8YGC9_ENSAD|nr:putative sulfate exporter family transporter [Ensifer adhaerens]USJ28412.1 putative sulfate exporter family transporter [Ensifer adhaerens]